MNDRFAPKLILVTLFLVCCLMSACKSSRAINTSLTTSTITPENDIALTITQTPSSVRTAKTVLATATKIPSTTPLPSSTATPNPAEYRLTTPSAEVLLGLLAKANSQYQLAHQQTDDDKEAELIRRTAAETSHAVEFDLERFYPDGLPFPENVLTIPWTITWSPRSIPTSLFADGIFAYLNSHGIRLQDQHILKGAGFKAEVHQVELDGDPGAEWLLSVESSKFFLQTWLTLDEGANGQFLRLNSDDLNKEIVYFSNTAIDLMALDDLTGDGLTDVVIHLSTYMWGTSYETIQALRGTSTGFSLLTSIPLQVFVSFDEAGTYMPVITTTDHLHSSLLVYYPHYWNWNCTWITTETYQWPNGVEKHTTQPTNPPNTPECMMAQAVSVSDPPDTQAAVRLLEQSLRGFARKPPGTSGFELFARFHLAILYALSGRDQAARQQLEWIKVQSNLVKPYNPIDASQFITEGIVAELNAPLVNPVRLCAAGYSLARHGSFIFQEWDPYLTATSAVQAYPMSYTPWPQVVCPLDEIIDHLLATIKVPPEESPESLLAQTGFDVKWIQPVSHLSTPAWVAIIQVDRPRVVMLFPGNPGGLALHTFADPIGDLLWLKPESIATVPVMEVVTQEEQVDLMLAYPVKFEDGYQPCDSNSTPYDIWAKTYRSFVTGIECFPNGQPADLQRLLLDANNDGISDWVNTKLNADSSLQLSYPDQGLWLTPEEVQGLGQESIQRNEQILSNLTKMVCSNTQPLQTRNLIASVITRVQNNKLESAYVLPNLQYLMALSYELEGNNEEATHAYFEIWQMFPHTLWSELAYSHLASMP